MHDLDLLDWQVVRLKRFIHCMSGRHHLGLGVEHVLLGEHRPWVLCGACRLAIVGLALVRFDWRLSSKICGILVELPCALVARPSPPWKATSHWPAECELVRQLCVLEIVAKAGVVVAVHPRLNLLQFVQ